MIHLPPALANPPDGRYSLDQAVTVWLAIYHGYQPGSPDSLDFRRARQRAARELEPIIQRDTPSAPTGPRIVRRQSTWFDHARNTPRESSRRVIKRTIASVTKSDMIELARQHGIEMEPQVQREPMEAKPREIPVIPAAKPGNAWVNDKAMAYVSERLAEKNPPKILPACREAVDKYFSGYHDPEGKAKSIAASIRQARRKAGITTE